MSLYAASVPVFLHYLDSLAGILAKAEAHAAERKIAPEVLLGLRLAPDMFALSRQVQVACDFAKNAAGRLAAVDVPKFPDEEKTFAELRERIARTKAYVTGISAAALEGAEARVITFPIGGKPHEMDGADYLYHFALPNFYFHLTAVYAILRANGVALGKGDYMGKVEGLKEA
ncbi:MAG: DUF1993 domain-containing protein [Methylocystis sp.]|nr:DUF1993 domain-containing protein [Methylocystis sp.]MCA3584562.1 DUF1993 domain-containing protein [Methylocystis sp.]MCA3588592.1 DUF1993 domain-containing protein [Methylocystis sp.]MCA3591339.1 DUF1993 domain-containing protein [Methylocystis sp.]